MLLGLRGVIEDHALHYLILLHAERSCRASGRTYNPAREGLELTRIDALLTDYGSYHRTRGNLMCHAFGITLIVYGLLALLQLAALPGGRWTLAEVFLAAASLYYLTLSVPLGLTMLAEAVALDLIARFVADWRIGLAAFVAGWIFQGIGHARYEKKSPAFFKNLLHLLVGPIFLWNELLHVRRIETLNH